MLPPKRKTPTLSAPPGTQGRGGSREASAKREDGEDIKRRRGPGVSCLSDCSAYH